MMLSANRIPSLLLAGAVIVWATGACSGDTPPPQVSSATHFLEDCSASCSSGLQCICGVCTKSCTATSDCTSITSKATCTDTSSTDPACGASTPAKVCDQPCTATADCDSTPGAPVCISGFCRSVATATMQPKAIDAGGKGGGTSGSGGNASGGRSDAGDAATGSGGSAPDGSLGSGGTSDAAGSGGASGSTGGAQSGTGGGSGGVNSGGAAGDASAGCQARVLYDPKNCGRCGHDCQGGICASGICQPVILALGQKVPGAIAIDSGNLYWANFGDWGGAPNGQISRVSSAAGGTLGVVTVLATGVSNPNGLAISDTSVFFSNQIPAVTLGNLTVGSLPKGGGAVTPVATGPRGIGAVAVNGTHVYWATDLEVRRAPLGGGSAELIATISGASAAPSGLALDATSVYWGDGSIVQKTPLDGGATVPLASGQAASEIAVHDARVYWTNVNTGTVMSASTDGTSTGIVAGSQDNPVGLAVDSSGIYWTNQGSSGTVLMRPLNGGQPLVLSSGHGAPSSMATDSNAIYWTNSSTGTIMKLAKP